MWFKKQSVVPVVKPVPVSMFTGSVMEPTRPKPVFSKPVRTRISENEAADKVEHLMLPIVRSMVDHPNKLEADILVTPESKTVLVELKCAKSDIA